MDQNPAGYTPIKPSPHLAAWLLLPDATRLNAFRETGRQLGLPAVAIEKDWWLVHTLAVVFSMECAPHLLFKGGTSLSKGWNLIERFSEDIDLALDRKYLGFGDTLTKADIRRLRRASYRYVSTRFVEELRERFSEAGFADVTIEAQQVVNSDQDPLIVEIYYPKLTETDTYLKPGLLIEVGSRSLQEPFSPRTFGTLVAAQYPGRPFSDRAITVPVVDPERTFLEKIFLLHEEFQRPAEKVRVERLSRHLYDIEKLAQSSHAADALQNTGLYALIVAHRQLFSHVAGVDYARHQPQHIRFLPPDDRLPLWESDYKQMQENMIYGPSLPFAELMKELTELQTQINSLTW